MAILTGAYFRGGSGMWHLKSCLCPHHWLVRNSLFNCQVIDLSGNGELKLHWGLLRKNRPQWHISRLNVVGHYNLLFNAALMVEQGMGIALCLDHLADTTENTGLTFRPLNPPMVNHLRLSWKKYQIFSPAADLFLKRMRRHFEAKAEI